MTYDFNWEDEVRIDSEVLPPDSLLRAQYAASLSTHIVRKSEDGDYVLNVNAGWGHGKTYFLKRWFKDIKENHPAVYVNAWKHDFSEDPLLTVVSELKSQLTDQFSLKGEKTKIDLGALVKAGAPLVAKGITRKLIGVGLDDIGDEYQSLAGEASEKFAQLMLAQHEEQVSSISSFRAQLSELATKISENSNAHELPVFVFIDELDRCRPTFAIELLETVKHLFDVKEFVFVIATDTEQLEHSIKAIYGNGFDARNYLSRFFSERVRLPRSSLADLLLQNNSFNFLFNYDDDKVFRRARIELESVAEALSKLLNDYSVPLRNTLKLIDRAAFAINSLEDSKASVDPLFLLLLLVIRESAKDCYASLMHDVKPDFVGEPYQITPKVFGRYSLNIIVEPEKLGHFEKSFQCVTKRSVKLSDLFNTRREELDGRINFESREADLLRFGREQRMRIPQKETYNLCMLYAPADSESLTTTGYNELIEHSMLLE